MGFAKLATSPRALFLSLAVFALVAIPRLAPAEELHLVILQSEGERAVYPLGDVERVAVLSAETLVVMAGGSDYYPAESIVDIQFLWGTSGVDDSKDAAGTKKAVHLLQNLPNPFFRSTRIPFDLTQSGDVVLRIYTPHGRLVRTLVAGQRGVGWHEVEWDGRDNMGREVASGVYFFSLKAPGVEESRRMILLH